MQTWRKCVALALLACSGVARAQTEGEWLSRVEERLQALTEERRHVPQLHGILRGKCEYQTEEGEGRFEVRNARLSAEGSLPLRSAYKLEVDLCDESSIKMKDAWVRVNPVGSLRITLGQQRLPFSIDAHRNPSAQYFANRSFIAKQVGDMRDVGAAVGYDVLDKAGRKVLCVDAGVYNGSNLDNQKTAWFSSPAYSARVQCFPMKGLLLCPSVQHQLIAGRAASYTSLDVGAYYERGGLHVEAEYLRKFYAHHAFASCHAVDAMAIYRHSLRSDRSFIQGVGYLLRYDYMGAHSDGKAGLDAMTGKLLQTDAERHRMTAGVTFSVRNPYFHTDIRLNYENYWYPSPGLAKESERDKLVVELMLRF